MHIEFTHHIPSELLDELSTLNGFFLSQSDRSNVLSVLNSAVPFTSRSKCQNFETLDESRLFQ